jgi:hypothetical protein
MIMKSKHFILQVFEVPENIQENDIQVSHDSIEEWELMDVSQEKGSNVANITLTTKVATSIESLEGNISVHSSKHDVQGVDLALAVW